MNEQRWDECKYRIKDSSQTPFSNSSSWAWDSFEEFLCNTRTTTGMCTFEIAWINQQELRRLHNNNVEPDDPQEELSEVTLVTWNIYALIF